MQASDGSSPGGRAALLRLSMDLQLHPITVAAALEYAFDFQHAFPDAVQTFCFGIVRQGYRANMQMLEVAFQKLQEDFGGIFGTPAVQHVSVGQWLAQPSTQSRPRLQCSMRASSSSNAMGHSAASFTPSAALIASWPLPQRRPSNVLSEAPSSSASALSGGDHELSSMVEDAKLTQY